MDKIALINWSGIFETIWSFILFSLPRVIIFSLILFLSSILLLCICRKYRLFQRKNKYWQLIIKINYLYIPILFICFGIACGSLYSAKSYIKKRHKEFLNPLSNTVVDGVVSYLSEIEVIEEIKGKEIKIRDFAKKIFGDFQYQPKSKSLLESQKAFLANKIIRQCAKWTLSMAVKKTLEEISARLHLDLNLEKDIIEFDEDIIDKLDFSNFDKKISPILTNAIHSKIQSVLGNLYGQFFITFLLFLLLPLAEIFVYFFWLKKKYGNL